MEFRFLILLSMLVGAALGQGLSCEYSEMVLNEENRYTCTLTVDNPNGLDDFTTIEGVHEEGRTNADVTAVFRNLAVINTPNFPRIICATFPNIRAIEFSFQNVTELTENSFAGCENVEWIYFSYNNIASVHEQTFASNGALRFLNLMNNGISSLPDNVFSNLQNLEDLFLSGNGLTVQDGLFRNLRSLKSLWLASNGISEINPQWFADLEALEIFSIYNNEISALDDSVLSSLTNLKTLEITGNPFQSISDGAFRSLANLEELFIGNAGIEEVNAQWFNGLTNLRSLLLSSNNIRQIQEGSFDSLTSLASLDIRGSRLTDFAIPANLFNNLRNLSRIDMANNLIQSLNPEWFQNLAELSILSLNSNQIQSLPTGILSPIRELNQLEISGNQLKTINRAAFGNIRNLISANFDSNNINAIDEMFLQDASPLDSLYLWGNLCTGERFYNFEENRGTFLRRLNLCTRNYEFIVETETQAGDDFRFFRGTYPGIQLRVNTTSSVRIALTSFDIPHNPMLEIAIGGNNNSLTQIIRNQDQVVVSVPTPNVLNRESFTGFRITWSQHVVLVSREDQQFPFLAYSMDDWFAVNFYGLQGEDDANWSIQPVEAEIVPE